jgi:hypothetical protein
MADNITGLISAMETCLDLGITTFDLADVYGWYQDGHGVSNDLLSKVFQQRPDLRAKVELVCKFGIRLNGGYHVDSSPEWIHESIDRYLTLFNTTYVDVVSPHVRASAAAGSFSWGGSLDFPVLDHCIILVIVFLSSRYKGADWWGEKCARSIDSHSASACLMCPISVHVPQPGPEHGQCGGGKGLP